MSDQLVQVYEGVNLPESELIHQELSGHGIHAFVDRVASPLDGLTPMGQGTPVMVREDDLEKAQQVINDYLQQQAGG